MWKKTTISQLCQIRLPIIQAGMAGSTSAELVAAVSEYGGLGTIGGGYDTTEKLKFEIEAVRALTDQPFAVNLFVPEHSDYTQHEVEKMHHYLEPYLDKFQLQHDAPELHSDKQFQELIQTVIDLKAPVCSFTFGIPSENVIQQLKNQGIIVIGCATSVEEAIKNERAGVDAIVAQGWEAGGHRGTFLKQEADEAPGIGLMALIPQVVDYVSVPVIGAGGIMDGRGISAALMLGAAGVQLGTAFLTTKESGANATHQEALMQHNETDTTLTRLFSGKWARGIKNQWIIDMRKQQVDPLPYPYQNDMTKRVRKMAAQQGIPDWTHLWSGQGLRLSRICTTKALLSHLEEETSLTLSRFNT